MEVYGLEEKKAIEWLKVVSNVATNKYTMKQQWYLKIILNLIEKQSKEIEELKEINRQVKFLYDDACKCLLNTIDKDKIKAKIEEVKDGTFDAEIVLQSLLEKE